MELKRSVGPQDDPAPAVDFAHGVLRGGAGQPPTSAAWRSRGFGRSLGQRQAALWIIVGLLGLGICLPLSTVLSQSFQVSRRDPTWTLRWYEDLASAGALNAIATTLALVLTAGALAVALGLVLAWMVERVDVPFAFLSRLVPIFPLLVPAVMGAAAWGFLLSPQAGYLNVGIRQILGSEGTSGPLNIFSLGGIVFVVTLYTVPFTYTIFYPAFRAMDGSLEEAAYVSGAGPITAARTIVLGVLKPAILGAILISFMVSMAHFAIPYMLGGGQVDVLTTRMFRLMRATFPANTGGATAMAMVALVPSVAFLLLQYRLLGRGSFAVVGGKGSRAGKMRQPHLRWLSAGFLATYAVASLALPVTALVLVSLSRFWTGRVDLDAMGLHHFRYLVSTYPHTFPSIRTSIQIALLGATMSVLLAFGITYLALRMRTHSARLLDVVGMSPAGIPSTVFGIGFLLTFIRPPIILYGSIWLILLAYLVMFLPYAIRPISAAIEQVSPELEDASRMAGASWLVTVGRVTLPLVVTSLLASWSILFVMLSREVSASIFLITPGIKLIGTTIFDLWVDGQSGQLAAYSLIIIASTLVFVAIAQLLANRRTLAAYRRG